MPNRINPRYDDRVAFCGQTGSGKSYLMFNMTLPLRRLAVIDPKGTLKGRWELQEPNGRIEAAMMAGKPFRVRYGPQYEGDPKRAYAEVLERLWRAGECTVAIDELYGLSEGRPSPELRKLYTMGREKHIGVWAAFQRPKWIPRFAMSEAKWLFLFRINDVADRKLMAAHMGFEGTVPPTRDRHGFWVYNDEWQSGPQYHRQANFPQERRAG